MESFIGYIKTPQDALIVFEACRKGILNQVQRRLTAKERSEIRSGSVFVWDEKEAEMRRWTDGRTWSPSRVLGSFLTYRELDTKRRPRKPSLPGLNQVFSYKSDGLIKQSFSICTASKQKLHLISYYSKKDILSGYLKRPSALPILADIRIQKGYYPEINSLDIGGGHTASIHSIQPHHDAISPPLSYSPWSSSDEEYYQQESHYPLLPTQDVPWGNLPCSEDDRQLNALRHQLRI
ncbi:Gti1/Pac2 family-domain-containing protein [Sporodiniella umbellata]|nr:Gti1/Pac2 family-domain-containing protein [Sporodiniella umbellata]